VGDFRGVGSRTAEPRPTGRDYSYGAVSPEIRDHFVVDPWRAARHFRASSGWRVQVFDLEGIS